MSRQNYYKHWRRHQIYDENESNIIRQVKEIRSVHPRIGGRKLYSLLSAQCPQTVLGTGRDALFDMLRKNALLIRKTKSRTITTWSNHPFYKYKNLIRNFTATAPNELWVSDITYLRTANGFLYLSLVTDAYSRKIVGYNLADNLSAVNALQALQMALYALDAEICKNLIHHSDRGIQYCTKEYTDLLHRHGIRISMTEQGDPLENAIAERVNGVIKNEYLQSTSIKSKEQAAAAVDRAIKIYNEFRPHMSCQMYTPQQVHEQALQVKRVWKTYYKKKKL